MFGLSFTEIAIIAILALLLLGPDQLPSMAKTAGKWMRELRRTSDDLRSTFETEIHKMEREIEQPVAPKPPPAPAPAAPAAAAASEGAAAAPPPASPSLPYTGSTPPTLGSLAESIASPNGQPAWVTLDQRSALAAAERQKQLAGLRLEGVEPPAPAEEPAAPPPAPPVVEASEGTEMELAPTFRAFQPPPALPMDPASMRARLRTARGPKPPAAARAAARSAAWRRGAGAALAPAPASASASASVSASASEPASASAAEPASLVAPAGPAPRAPPPLTVPREKSLETKA